MRRRSLRPDHDQSGEIRIVPHDRHQIAVCRNHFQSPHRRGQISHPVSGPMRTGGDRTGNRDVRQRGHGMEGDAFTNEHGRQIAVGHPDRHHCRHRPAVNSDILRQLGEGHQRLCICHLVKRMACANCEDRSRSSRPRWASHPQFTWSMELSA